MEEIIDLTKRAPRSPHARLGSYVALPRIIDKARAHLAGRAGEYHFDSPLDHLFFDFKGLKGADFLEAVKAARSDEEVLAWVNAHGATKTEAEIADWVATLESRNPHQDPNMGEWYRKACQKLGLDPAATPVFDYLEADDKASFA